jgi:hypothetical protein
MHLESQLTVDVKIAILKTRGRLCMHDTFPPSPNESFYLGWVGALRGWASTKAVEETTITFLQTIGNH